MNGISTSSRPPGPKHPVDLAERERFVFDVLERRLQDHRIEARVREGHILSGCDDVDPWGVLDVEHRDVRPVVLAGAADVEDLRLHGLTVDERLDLPSGDTLVGEARPQEPPVWLETPDEPPGERPPQSCLFDDRAVLHSSAWRVRRSILDGRKTIRT